MEVSRLNSVVELDTTQASRNAKSFERDWQNMSSEINKGFNLAAGFAAFQGLMNIGQRAFAAIQSSAIGMNAQLESSTLQFATLMGSADEASKHVAALFEYAKETPFETQPIIEASRMLETFGGAALNTEANIRLVGDASAAVQAPLENLSFWVGRLYSNIKGGQPFGEAASRLQELAVMGPEARAQMEALQKAGASSSEVWAVFTKELQRFTGATKLQAQSWQGLTSTFTDSINILMSTAFKPLFDVAKEVLTVINSIVGSDTASAWARAFADGLTAVIYAGKQLVATLLEIPAIGAAIRQVASWFYDLNQNVLQTDRDAKELDKSLSLRQGVPATAQAGQNLESMAASGREADSAIKALDKQLYDIEKSTRGIQREIDDINDLYGDQIDSLEEQLSLIRDRRDYIREEKLLLLDLEDLEISRAEEIARGDRAIRTRLENQIREIESVQNINSLIDRRADIEERLRGVSESAASLRLKELDAEERMLRMREREEDIRKGLNSKDPAERKRAQEALQQLNRDKERLALQDQIEKEREEAEKARAARQKEADILELASINRRLELAQMVDQEAISALQTAKDNVQAQKDAINYVTQREEIEGRIAALPLEQQVETLRKEHEAIVKPLQEQLQILGRQREDLSAAKSDWSQIKSTIEDTINLQKQAVGTEGIPQANRPDVTALMADMDAKAEEAKRRGEQLGQNLTNGIWQAINTFFSTTLPELPGRIVTWFSETFSSIDWAGIWGTISNTAVAFWDYATDVAGRFWTWIKTQVSSIDWVGIWQSVSTTATEWWSSVTDLGSRFIAWVGTQFASLPWERVWSTVADTAVSFWNWSTKLATDLQAWLKSEVEKIAWDDVWSTAKGFSTSGENWLTTQWNTIQWPNVFSTMSSFTSSLFEAISKAIVVVQWEDLGATTAQLFLGALVALKAGWDKAVELIAGALTGAFKGGLLKLPVQLLGAIAGFVSGFVLEIAKQIANATEWGNVNTEIKNKFSLSAVSWIDGVMEGFRKKRQALNDQAASLGTGTVDSINEELGAHSPATALIPTGVSVVEGIALGIQQALLSPVFVEALAAIPLAIVSALGGITDADSVGTAQTLLIPVGQQMMSGLLGGLIQGFGILDSTQPEEEAIKTVLGWFQLAFGPEGFLVTSLLSLNPMATLFPIGQHLAEGVRLGLQQGFFGALDEEFSQQNQALAQIMQGQLGNQQNGDQFQSIIEWFTLTFGPEGTLVQKLKEISPEMTLVPIGMLLMSGLFTGMNIAWGGAEASGASDAAVAAGQTAAAAAGQAAALAAGGILPWLKTIPAQIVAAIDNPDLPAIDILFFVGYDIMSGLWDGAIEEWYIQEVWWTLLPVSIQAAILSSLFPMQDAGRAVMQGFERGYEQEWQSNGKQWWINLGQEIKRTVDSWPARELLAQPGKDLMEGLKQAIEEGAKQVLDVIRRLGKDIKSAFEEITEIMEEVASQANDVASQVESAAARVSAAAAQMQGAMLAMMSFGGFSGGGGVTAFAKGGILTEPVIGFGQRTGEMYTFAEQGPEAIVPLSMRGSGQNRQDLGSVGAGSNRGGNTFYNVYINAGSVIAERDLVKKVRDGLLQLGDRNVDTGIQARRR